MAGNVRELRNLIERVVILTPGETVDVAAIREALPVRRHGGGGGRDPGRPLREIMAELERDVVVEALERNQWRMAATARELGLERSHLYKKLKVLGVDRPDD